MCTAFFFFNDTATTEIYTLSLHDALPISRSTGSTPAMWKNRAANGADTQRRTPSSKPNSTEAEKARSEEHTSELQSPCNLVCRLLLEKKKTSEIHEQPTHEQRIIHDDESY